MSSPGNFIPVPAVSDPVIAGKNKTGIAVYCTQDALTEYNGLVALAQSGNYWAQAIVKGISGLASSRLSMDNVFTEPGKIAYGPGIFYVALPGVTATFEALTNGSFKLMSLKIDPGNPNYFQGQRAQRNPGLWRVKRETEFGSDSDYWKATFVRNGQLFKKHQDRYVVISDLSFSEVDEAARYASASLQGINSTVRDLIERRGFDMHFTPGNQRADGLVNSKQAINRVTPAAMIRDSAQVLAHTMYLARNNDNIQWFSDWDGSKVLTQAMQMLVNQNVKLDKHTILMNHPTSRPSQALRLGEALGLKPFDDRGVISKGIPSGKEIIGRLGFLDLPMASLKRLFQGKTSPKQALVRSTDSALSLTGSTVSALGVLAAVGFTAAGSPIVGAVGAAVSVTNLIVNAYRNRRRRN